MILRQAIIVFVAGLLLVSCDSWGKRQGVNPEKAEALKAAAPLNHSVRISRTGRVLKLDYKLIGSDGKTYSLWDISERGKPTFSIYHNDVKVGGGTFEFG